MKKLLHIILFFASLSAFGQAQSDASLSTQSTDEIKNKTLNQTRIDAFNQDVILSKSSNVPTANTQTGNYTLEETDIGKTVIMNVGSANDLTIPPNSSVAFPVGTMIVCFQNGTGTTTVQAGVGVTINNTAGNNDAPAQYAPFVLHKTATDTWTLSNGLSGGAASLTDGEGTTANGTSVDLGGAVTGTIDFTGTGNWNWGSNGTPYDGFLVFKGLYTGSTGGFHSEVRTASTQHSLISQFGDNLSFGMRDGISGASRTSIVLDGSSNGTLSLQANNRLSLQTFSNNVNLILDADDGVSLKLGSDATGDTYYRNSSGFLTRLPVGTDGEVLKLVSGIPSWETDGGGGGGEPSDGDKGDITVTSTGTVWTIDNLVVTPAKMSTFSSSDMRGKYTDETGTGAAYFQGGDIGTPSAGVGTNITGIPYANLTGTAPFWALASGGAQTADNTISGAFKTSFTTNSVGIGNSGTHLAKLDVLDANTTSATNTFNAGTASDATILTLRSDGVIFAGLNTSTMSTTTQKFIFTSPWAYSTGSGRIQAIDGTSHFLGTAGVRIAAHNAGTVQTSTGNGIVIETASDYIWYRFTNTGLGASNRMNRFSGIHQATVGSVTSTFIEITTGLDNNTTAQSNVSAIGIDYNPTNTGTLTNHYAALFRSGSIGVGTSSPVSRMDVSASFGAAIASTSTDITLDETHHTILVDASGAARTITLPAAAGCTRRIYVIKKTDSSGNSVTIDGNASETIDGATTSTLAAQWNTKVIQSNGTSWFITSSF